MTYTTILLGTDTKYLPKASVDYPRGESLGAMAAFLQGNSALPNTQQLKVIEGPDTLGKNIGEKISEAVLAILSAIDRGETQINLVGHSRGGIEAILVAWELQRIFDAHTGMPLADILLQTPCPYTKAEYQKALPTLTDVQKKLQKVQLNLLTLDPVAGDNYLFFPTGWNDKRYFSLPNIVKSYETYICENERTYCFTSVIPTAPIEVHTKDAGDSQLSYEVLETEEVMQQSLVLPKASTTRSYQLFAIPGHHGTASGNPLDQQKKERVEGTEHIQDLICFKILNFLQRNGVVFPTDIDDAFSEEQFPLKKIYHEFLQTKFVPGAIQKLLLETYTKVLAHREGYRRFNQTTYAYLGREPAVETPRPGLISSRVVRKDVDEKISLNQVFGFLEAGFAFVNHEHAYLYLMNFLTKRAIDDADRPQFLHSVLSLLQFVMLIAEQTESTVELDALLKRAKGELQRINEETDFNLERRRASSDPEIRALISSVLGVIKEATTDYLNGDFSTQQREEIFSTLKSLLEYIQTTISETATERKECVNVFLAFVERAVVAAIKEVGLSELEKLESQLAHYEEELDDNHFILDAFVFFQKASRLEEFSNHIDELLKISTNIVNVAVQQEVDEKFSLFLESCEKLAIKVSELISNKLQQQTHALDSLSINDNNLSKKLAAIEAVLNSPIFTSDKIELCDKIREGFADVFSAAKQKIVDIRAAYQQEQERLFAVALATPFPDSADDDLVERVASPAAPAVVEEDPVITQLRLQCEKYLDHLLNTDPTGQQYGVLAEGKYATGFNLLNANETTKKVLQKYRQVKELRDILVDDQPNKINRFKADFTTKQSTIWQHRDKALHAFLSAVIIIFTGVVPGLIALCVRAYQSPKVRETGLSLFQSQGENWLNQTAKLM